MDFFDSMFSLFLEAVFLIIIAALTLGFKRIVGKRWYIFQGHRTGSFIYHGIALACENLNYDENQGDLENLQTNCHWNVDFNGRGRVDTPLYSLFSTPDGSTTMVVSNALEFENKHKDFAEDTFKSLQTRNDGLRYHLNHNSNGNWVISIEGEIQGNPKEWDARYYITGFFDDVIGAVRIEINRLYSQYKIDHPYNI